MEERYWDGQTWTDQTRAGQPPVVQAQAAPGNGFAVAALVLGIVAVVCGLIPFLFFLAWILGVLGLIFGLLGRGRAQKEPAVGRKVMATWGAALGAVAIALGVVGLVLVGDAVDEVSDDLNTLSECIENADTPAELDEC